GLLFVVLPAVFNQIPFGAFFLLLFLLLFLFATLTSAFSMLEIIVAAVTKGDASKRSKTTWITGILIFAARIPAALSAGVLADVQNYEMRKFYFSKYLVSNILIPIGALMMALYTGFIIPRKRLLAEMTAGSYYGKKIFAVWLLIIKYIVPIAII